MHALVYPLVFCRNQILDSVSSKTGGSEELEMSQVRNRFKQLVLRECVPHHDEHEEDLTVGYESS